MKKIILFILLVSSNWIYSQTWNSVQFKNPTLSALDTEIEHSIKDGSDNVYTKEFNSYNNLNTNVNVISKYNSGNTLLWSKNVIHPNIPTNSGNIYNRLQVNANDVYLGSHTSSLKGIIVKTPNSNVSTYTTWELLGGSAASFITDFKIVGNNLYAIGFFGQQASASTNVTFNGGSSKTVPANRTYSFIAKYSVSPKQLVWVKVVESTSYATLQNLELDSANNLYISGKYSYSATFDNGGNSVSFSGNQNTVFLAKFNSNGDFDTSFGLKQNSPAYNAFSVKVDNSNVIYSTDNDVHSYTQSGTLNWERQVPTLGTIYDIETNSCGDVIVTGDSYEDVARGASFAPDSQNFFGILLNKNNGNTMWVSNALNNANRGKKVLTYSDDSIKFLGDFHHNGINIDGNSSSMQEGIFFAKLNSQNTNSCCNYTVNLGPDIVACQGQTLPSINIFNQGFDDPNFVITWFLNGHLIQTGGLQLMSSVLTGTVTVQVTYPGCETNFTDSLTITSVEPIVIDLQDIYYNCEGNELELCGPVSPHANPYTYMWALQNNPLVYANGQCFAPTQPGNYVLTVSDANGCTSATHNFTVSNQLPTVELGHDLNLCVGDHFPPISIANQGFDNSNAIINWYQDGNLVQTGGTTLQYLPTNGTISVTVSTPGCQGNTIDQIEVTIKICCPEEVNIGLILCPGKEPIFNVLSQGFDDGNTIITWYFNGQVIQNGGEILEQSLYGNGVITVTIEKEGCRTIKDNFTISCDSDDTPKPCFKFLNVVSQRTSNSYYGPMTINEFCVQNKVFIDGSCSQNENGYHIRISEFDLASWTFVQDLYSGWVAGSGQAPSNISLNSLIGSNSFVPGKIYLVSLSTGFPWTSSPPQFFRVLKGCTGMTPIRDKEENKIGTDLSSITITPNPTTDIVNFRFDNSETGKVEIYSLEGKLISSQNFNETNQLSTNLGEYSDGIYIARITVGDKTINKKIIKE